MRRLLGRRYLAVIVFIAIAAFAVYHLTVPNISRLKKENPKITSFMEYRALERIEKGKKPRSPYAVWVPFSGLSPYLVKAVIIAEDDKFWSHEGFDYEAMQKALEKNVKAKRFRAGGSTISQQLAKNLFLTPKKSIFRKLKEALITWRIEHTLSKRRILEIYLNVVEWGDNIYGAEAASRHYFGKSAAELTPMEAARLVSALPNPRRFNPAGDQEYIRRRSELIYGIMVKRGIVVQEFEEVMEDKGEPVEGAVGTGATTPEKALDAPQAEQARPESSEGAPAAVVEPKPTGAQ